jgi:hypothetical protein
LKIDNIFENDKNKIKKTFFDLINDNKNIEKEKKIKSKKDNVDIDYYSYLLYNKLIQNLDIFYKFLFYYKIYSKISQNNLLKVRIYKNLENLIYIKSILDKIVKDEKENIKKTYLKNIDENIREFNKNYFKMKELNRIKMYLKKVNTKIYEINVYVNS